MGINYENAKTLVSSKDSFIYGASGEGYCDGYLVEVSDKGLTWKPFWESENSDKFEDVEWSEEGDNTPSLTYFVPFDSYEKLSELEPDLYMTKEDLDLEGAFYGFMALYNEFLDGINTLVIVTDSEGTVLK